MAASVTVRFSPEKETLLAITYFHEQLKKCVFVQVDKLHRRRSAHNFPCPFDFIWLPFLWWRRTGRRGAGGRVRTRRSKHRLWTGYIFLDEEKARIPRAALNIHAALRSNQQRAYRP